ncbi:MAG: hypothetical protein A2V77_17795 [Anaeromyxobacter sp. RBG_16_69_14]|nr:MAG: hypothetical protein A2V77_17795 [Anaeromyxobacter sp. RBG_16_69_14]
MHRKFYREVRALELQLTPAQDAIVTDADLAPLPAAAQRYLRFMGAVGKPRIWSLRVGFEGRFKLARDSDWLPCKTIQYNSRDELARLFYMTIRVKLIPMLGRDTYLRGKGRMLGRALDLITVVDGSGPEFDIGELVTYLNDAILMAPSMLLGSETTWTAVDDLAFDITFADRGTTVRARVFLDERGAPMNFSTTDRFMDDPARPGHYVRARWMTPMDDWMEVEGRRLPTSGKAVWYPEGAAPLPYADFRLVAGTVAFNVAPGEAPAE